jgi:hypothetical protein
MTDRSVLGTMRVADIDLSWHLPDDLNVMDCDPVALSLSLNDRPLTIRGGWIWANKEMMTLVERLCNVEGQNP